MDTVLDADTHEIVFSGSKAEVWNFLAKLDSIVYEDLYVISVDSRGRLTVEEYLAIYELKV